MKKGLHSGRQFLGTGKKKSTNFSSAEFFLGGDVNSQA